MKNIFSSDEPEVRVDLQVPQQPGGGPIAPSCSPRLPEHSVSLPSPDLDGLAERSAPGSAVSSSLTYIWRR